jgi:hypothetical protein
MRNPSFSHGIIYSRENGEIYHKIASADKTKFSDKKFFKNLKITHKLNLENVGNDLTPGTIVLPSLMDGFHIRQTMAVDDFGNIYVKYIKATVPDDPSSEVINRIYKFDSKGRLLAGFNFYTTYFNINLENGTLYHWEFEKNGIQFVKWEKS